MENNFYTKISELTKLINGQYPRPWTTNSKNPSSVKGFIVGMNQATSYTEEMMSHKEFLDYHFGVCGTSYDLYKKVRKEPSKTRINIELLSSIIDKDILETDVICYSTPRAKHLSNAEHFGGRERGLEIFKTVLGYIEPKFIVVYGAKAQSTFKTKLKGVETLKVEDNNLIIETMKFDKNLLCSDLSGSFETKVFFIKSIALPEWNKWKNDAPKTFESIKNHLNTMKL